MDINKPPSPEKSPSLILRELGFTLTGVTDTDEEPRTFDIVIGTKSTVAIAYDQYHREWALSGTDADEIERKLIKAGFQHAPSVFSPGPGDAIN